MTDAALRELAAEVGIATAWRDAFGQFQDVSVGTLRAVLAALGFAAGNTAEIREAEAALRAGRQSAAPGRLVTADCGAALLLRLPPGRARLRLESGETSEITLTAREGLAEVPAIDVPGYHRLEFADRELTLAVAPSRGFSPGDVAPNPRLWGLAAQVYALRGQRDGGFGMFTDLAEFATGAGRAGADMLAISPVHAQFAADMTRFTPYSPSSRVALNPLHADPGAVIGPDPTTAQGNRIDWASAQLRHRHRLRAAFTWLRAHPAHPLAVAFARFGIEAAPELRQHAIFEALHAQVRAQSPDIWQWRDWPAPWRDANSEAVRVFAAEHAEEVAFHLFGQFLAWHGLARAQDAARAAGMRIGLITDLAVGADGSGSDAWARPDQTLIGLSIGAPPDLLNALGQDWGLTAFSPTGLARHGYDGFLAMLRAALRHAGGVRMDHVMGLARLWVIPEGAGPREGAYLHYPMQDLLRLLALESHRHRAIVLGEDLGTLPDGFQPVLTARQVLGLRVLWFEQEGETFRAPQHWASAACAMTSTHDLATLAGWWREHDLEVRRDIGLLGDDAGIWYAHENRARERGRLWRAFEQSGAATTPMPAPDDPAPMVDAAIAHVGRTTCQLALLPAEDALGLTDQPNLPGTTHEHPNWCQRLPTNVARFFADPDVTRRLAAFAATRAREGGAGT